MKNLQRIANCAQNSSSVRDSAKEPRNMLVGMSAKKRNDCTGSVASADRNIPA